MVALSSTVSRRMTISSGVGGPASSLPAHRTNVTARSQEVEPTSERQQANNSDQGLTHAAVEQTQASRLSHAFNKHPTHSPLLRTNAPPAQSPHLSSNDIRQAHLIPSGTTDTGSATSAVPSWGGGAPAMNTELRAKARRQREQSRDKGRDKLFVAPLQTHVLHQASNQGQAASPFGASAHEVTDASSVIGSASFASSNETGRVTANVSSSQVGLKRSSPRLEGRKGSSNMPVSNASHPPSAVHAVGRNPISQQHKTAHHLVNGQHAAHHRTLNITTANKIAAAQSVIDAPTMPTRHQAPLRAMSEAGGSVQEGLPTSIHGFEQMLARIPSPPTRADTQSDEQVTQTTLFVKQYYALLDKCQAWQRYAASMKEKADNLEIENRFLRESGRKNEDEVRALERQLHGLKETAMLLDEERRRTESRIGTYNTDVDRRRQPSRQHFVRNSSEELQVGLMAIDHIPSPPGVMAGPNGVYSSGSSNAQSFSGGLSVGRIPSRSSNMQSEDDTPLSSHFPVMDFINLQEAGKTAYPNHLDAIAGQAESHIGAQYASTCIPNHVHLPARHHREESAHLAELIAQDAAQREMTMLQGAHHQALVRGRAGMSESRSFPSSDNIPSASLTTQILTAHTREHGIAAAINRLPSSTSAPVLRAKLKTQSPNQQQPSQQQLRHQASEGNTMSMVGVSSASLKRRELHQHSSRPGAAEATFGLGLEMSELNEQMTKLSMPPQSGRLSAVPGSRSTSVQSDTRTVTEDYLQGMVEQKRHLRKISLSQQQQMHYLQARVQMNRSNSSLAHAHGDAAQRENDENVAPPMSAPLPSESRPDSRLSSSGTRRRPRSRAGSYSLHDAIPISKDDVFSSQSEMVPRRGLKRSESVPLGQLTLNGRSGAVSALELRHYNDDRDTENEGQQQKSAVPTAAFESASLAVNNLSDTGEGSVASVSRSSSQENIGERHLDSGAEDNDPKGAHRRLYIRLREELVPTELVRFERYVHRYDALQIEMEGAKGIINRVRRLLLPEEVVRAKHTHRDRYQFRKELAREFERIVRDDAVPSEAVSTQPVQERSPTHAFV